MERAEAGADPSSEAPAASRAPRLQRALLAWLLPPLMVLLVLDTAVSWWSAVRSAEIAQDRHLAQVAQLVARAAREEGDRLVIDAGGGDLLADASGTRRAWRIADADGRHLGGDAGLGGADGPIAAGAAPRVSDHTLQGHRLRVASAWLPVPARGGASMQVQVAEDVEAREALAREIFGQELAPQLLLIALATATVYLGVRRGLRPLSQLQRSLASRSHRDLRPLPLEGLPAEVRPLALELNGLMQRLGHAMDLQSRFVADAAHQLKTPVSGLKAQIELASREHDAAALHLALQSLRGGVERLSRLVAQLLALARNEPEGANRLQLERLDLAAFALEVSMAWVPVAIRRGIDLGFDGPAEGPAWVDGDASRLRDLLDNLIDNAVRYSHEGGRVTVAVKSRHRVSDASGGSVRLSVHDDSERIPVAERQRIFERFHRLLGTQAEGSGLGLAIVSEIAALHGARVTLEDDDDGIGNTFIVSFPGGAERDA